MGKKLGPLAMWQWAAIGVAVGIVYYFYKSHQPAAPSATQTATAQQQADQAAVNQQISPYNTALYTPTDPLTQAGNAGMTRHEMQQILTMLAKLESPHHQRDQTRLKHDQRQIQQLRRELQRERHTHPTRKH